MADEELLRSLSKILNAHQDIEDILDDPGDLEDAFARIDKANAIIGREVVKHLPE